MASLYLRRLSGQERAKLIDTLLESQNSNCFICGRAIHRTLHHIDIDHIEPITAGGKDGWENLAVTHDGCNRAKQASDLRVARILRLRYTVSFGLDSLDAGSGGLGLAGVGWEEAEQGRSSDSMR